MLHLHADSFTVIVFRDKCTLLEVSTHILCFTSVYDLTFTEMQLDCALLDYAQKSPISFHYSLIFYVYALFTVLFFF